MRLYFTVSISFQIGSQKKRKKYIKDVFFTGIILALCQFVMLEIRFNFCYKRECGNMFEVLYLGSNINPLKEL